MNDPNYQQNLNNEPNFNSNNNTNNQAPLLPQPHSKQQQQQLLPNPNQNIPLQQHQQLQQLNFILPNPPAIANQNPQNSTLILKKVSPDWNRVDRMRQHFGKFGQLIEIQCHYEQQVDCALIRFATQAQANAAFKSPQPVFNNRFIRLYWLNAYQKLQQNQQQQQPQQQQNVPVPGQISPEDLKEPASKKQARDRLSFPTYNPTPNHNNTQQNQATGIQPVLNKENAPSTIVKSTSSSALSIGGDLNKTSEAIEKSVSIAEAKKLAEQNQKKALLLKNELKKKACELIEKQIKDQKVLMQKFDQAKTVEEKNQILDLIKKLSEAIEKEKEILNDKTFFTEIKPAKPAVVPAPQHLLKLNNKKVNSSTSFLKATAAPFVPGSPHQTTALPAIATSPKVHKPPNMYQNPFHYVKVDNRPKQLLFSGVDGQKEKTSIVNFVNSIGLSIESLVDRKTAGEENLKFVINFPTRRDAEIVSFIFFLANIKKVSV
jgi:hypothetical protein